MKFGKGFSLSNIKRFRQFYIVYQKGAEPSHLFERQKKKPNPIGATLSHQLGNKNLNLKGATVSRFLNWSHYVELLKIESPIERNFYEKQSLIENWSIRELKRQKKSSLFLRLAAGKNKNEILQLSQQRKIISKPARVLKSIKNKM